MTVKNPVELWIEALRSGKYKQGKTYLHQYDEFCCLGVACHLYQTEGPGDLRISKSDYKVYSYDKNSSGLPSKVKDWLGIKTAFGKYKSDVTRHLTEDNDLGKTFKEIADIIESEPEGLFNDK